MLREVKPRNAHTARILKQREPKPVEARKRTLILHGPKCPSPVHSVLKTVHVLTRPHSVLLTKRNEGIHPFETNGVASLEFLADKNECGLVLWGSSTKKKPNALTVLRIFDGKVLDGVELLLLLGSSSNGDGRAAAPLPALGVDMKPMMLFAGTVWADTSDSELARTYNMVRSLLLDIFSGEEVRSIDVEGLQYLLMVAAGEPENDGQAASPYVHLRWYKIRTKRSGHKLPRIELDEVGPKFDFKIGRTREADSDVMKRAMKHARRTDGDFRSKQKNIGMDVMGDKIGKVHLSRQDLGQLQTRKMKGLKRGPDLSDDEAQVEGEGEDEDDDSLGGDGEVGGVELDDGMDIDEVSGSDGPKRPRLR